MIGGVHGTAGYIFYGGGYDQISVLGAAAEEAAVVDTAGLTAAAMLEPSGTPSPSLAGECMSNSVTCKINNV